MTTTVRYDIVDHRGDSAVSINGKIYDSADEFMKDYPKSEFEKSRFESVLDFSWQEMVDDMVEQWA